MHRQNDGEFSAPDYSCARCLAARRIYNRQCTSRQKAITQSLNNIGISPTQKSKSSVGKKNCYPIGTVAVVNNRNVSFYLLAISEFDEKNKAQSTKEDIKAALVSMIDYYDTYGQGADLYLPFIGTGRSRALLSYQESFDLIKSTLIHHQEKIQGKIVIMALPEAISEIQLYKE